MSLDVETGGPKRNCTLTAVYIKMVVNPRPTRAPDRTPNQSQVEKRSGKVDDKKTVSDWSNVLCCWNRTIVHPVSFSIASVWFSSHAVTLLVRRQSHLTGASEAIFVN